MPPLTLPAASADSPPTAAGLLIFGVFIISFQDSLVKLVSADISLWHMQTLRSSFNLLLLTVLSRFLFGATHMRPQRIWAIALRSSLLVATMCLFFAGIPMLSLPEMAAGLYVFPLFIVVLSIFVPGERAGDGMQLVAKRL